MDDMIRKLKEAEKVAGVDLSDVIARLQVKPKKYGIVFEEHPEKVDSSLLTHKPVFIEAPELAVNAGSKQGNTLIEGDNLPALHALREAGVKVDVIYIDPPYNTGNEFTYNDRMVGKDDAYRHSKWLSFMSRRLRVARELMSDDGVIFVSIDDNEQAQLKMLMDEVFGSENFIANIIWRKQGGGKNDSKYISTNTEYLTIYRKSEALETFSKMASNIKNYKNIDSDGRHYMVRTWGQASLSYTKTLDYPVIAPDGTEVYAGGSKEAREERLKGNHAKKDWRWRGSEKTFWERHAEGRMIVQKDRNGNWTVYEKVYHDTVSASPFLNFYDEVTNRMGKNEVKSIFGKDVFSYPKPMEYIKFLINLHPNKNAVILDFFAGSGTTGHAVLELNKEDGGSRRFILVTNNEGNICEDVTRRRLYNVIHGIRYKSGEQISAEPFDAGVSYYRVDEQKLERPVDIDYDDGTLRHHILCALKIRHHLSREVKAGDDLYTLTNCSAQHHVFFGDHVTDALTQLELPPEYRHVVHVAPHLTGDDALERFDAVESWGMHVN